MELTDSDIKTPTEDRVIKTQTTDTEVKCSSVTMEDTENKMITEHSNTPEKPKGVTSDNTGLIISWDVSPCNVQAIDFFELQWKKTEEKRWSERIYTDDNSTNITIPITKLEINSSYQFKVRWITKEGEESSFSDISDVIIIMQSQKPGKPKEVTINDKDLLIRWDVSTADLQTVDVFEIQWKKKDVKRWSGRKYTNDNSTSIRIPITDLEKNTVYQFKVRWTTQEGAESSFSDISDDIIIKMSQKPGEPKGIINNDTDLLLSWDVSSTDLEAVDVFEIQWKKKEDKRWSGRKYTDYNSTSITLPITGLEKNIAYQFKVRWTTKEGVESPFSDISDDIIIKISQKPGKPIGDTSSDKVLLLRWHVPPTDLQAVETFEIKWKKSQVEGWLGKKCTNDNSTSIEILITEFEKNTAYQFAVGWITKEGAESVFSDISDDIIIQTKHKPGKPRRATSSDTNLLLSWDVSSVDLQSVDVFEIQWKKKAEKRWPGRRNTDDNSTSINIPITELETNTAYQFKVRWITQEGAESPFSDISDVIIIEMSQKPGKPKGITSNNKELLLSWDVSSTDLQVVDIFEIQWKKAKEKRWSGIKNTDDNSSSIRIPITELETNAVYQFKVRWITHEGVESHFSDISDEIVINISHKPGKPRAVTSNDKDLVLSWDVSSTDLHYADFFEIQWKKKEEKRWPGRKNTDDNSPTIIIPVTELAKNTVYQFKVRWITRKGDESQFSDISDDIIIKMSPKPGKPKGMTSNDKDLVLTWEVSSDDLQAVDIFEIQWKKAEEKRWSGMKITDDNSTSTRIPIIELAKNTVYQFKVRWITRKGEESPFSDISDDIIMKMSQKPGKPKGITSNNKDLLLSWDVSSAHLQTIDIFEIQWKKVEEKRWSGMKKTDDKSPSIRIPFTELETNAVYQFKVRWATLGGEESSFSDISDDIIIKMSEKPGKPKGITSNDKDLLISWNVSSNDLQAIDIFEIQWKKTKENEWSRLKNTNDNSTSIKIPITDLEKNIAYQFKVRWRTNKGVESAFSDISDDVLITRSPQQPGQISCSNVTATSACLSWEKPKGLVVISYYEVKYRSCTEVQWLSVILKQATESLDLKDLKSKNNYEFKVRAIFSDGNEGPFSEVSDTVTTQESLAARLKTNAVKVDSGKPQKYQIPLTFSKEATNTETRTRKGRFGTREKNRSTKTIMLIGATGAGKSTLIDGMINYIVDVALDDDFRFTMIDLTDDEKAKVHKQASSQTSWITCYEVNYQHGSRLNYNLNIIDTPGFGDTRGVQYDKQIVDQIREFFRAPGDQGIDIIDAVCFVTQASLPRLTHTQKYIFDSILSVFGKDIKDNIFVLNTFADGKESQVLAALQEAKVPFQEDKTFNFNNSALFKSVESSDQFTRLYWKLGITSFDTFFGKLHYAQQRSLRLTSEVLALRRQIENTIERLQPQIQDGLHAMDTMRKETELLERHKRDIEENRNFTYVSEEFHQRVVPTEPEQYVTNCIVCNCTCHQRCRYADNNDKVKCCAMGKDGNCKVCSGKCHWMKHINNNFYYETYVKKVERTYADLKLKHESAITGQKEKMSLIESIKSALRLKGQHVLLLMKTVRENINTLEQCALKPNPLSEVNYVILLIESEKREAKLGWKERLQVLEEIKKKAELVQKIPNKPTEWTEEDVERLFKNH